MNDKQLNELHQKLDRVLEALPVLDALGMLLIRRKDANERAGLGKNTIANNQNIRKFEIQGKKATLLHLSDLNVIQQRKRGR